MSALKVDMQKDYFTLVCVTVPKFSPKFSLTGREFKDFKSSYLFQIKWPHLVIRKGGSYGHSHKRWGLILYFL